MKNLVVGNFGFRKKQLDGQTIKSRLFQSALNKLSHASIIDVGGINPFISILKILLFTPFYHSVYFLPGKKQLYFLSPILVFYKYIFSINIHYIVVGGWIKTLADKNFYIKFLIQKFDSINIEVPSIVESMRCSGYKVNLLTNFRLVEESIEINKTNSVFKFIYFSRVMREKGIFEALDLIDKLNNTGNKIVSLNIFGPLSFNNKEDEKLFLNRVRNIKNIFFNGILQPQHVYKTISQFDYLIFPTSYDGEGVPGCIIDAKISGVPTICTDWKYNSEVVNNFVDGVVFNNTTFIRDAFFYIEELSINDVDIMKKEAKKSSERYTETAFLTWFYSL